MSKPLIEVIESLRAPPSLFKFFSNSLEHLRREGVSFEFHTEFARLYEINLQNLARGWFPLMPMFNFTSYPDGQAVWIEGISESGETVMTEAVRLYRVRSLAEEFKSLRMFYREPAKSAAPDERCLCDTQSASQLGGLIACSGAGWARPDYRGKGFAAHVPRMVHGLACLLWRPNYIIGLVEPVLVQKGMVPIYGFPRSEAGIHRIGLATESDDELYLLWMTRGECVSDLRHFKVGECRARAAAA